MTARTIEFNRNKAGVEDLELGIGIASQTRNGVAGGVTRINADHIPFDDTGKSVKTAIEEGHFDNAEDATPDNIRWDADHTLRQEITEGFAGKATKEEVAEARIRNWEAGVGYKRNDTVYYESSNLTGVFFWNSDIVALNVSPETNQGWVRIGSDSTDLSGHATTEALETETRLRTEADTALAGRDTAIEVKADDALTKLGELSQEIMDLPELPIDEDGVRLARLAREANALATSTNASDIRTERAARELADTNLGTRITSETNNRVADVNEVYRRITALGTISTPAQITQSANNAITTSIASGAIKLALDEIVVSGGGTEGALVLEDLALGATHTCNVSVPGREYNIEPSSPTTVICETPIPYPVVAGISLTSNTDLDISKAVLTTNGADYTASVNGRVLTFKNVILTANSSLELFITPNGFAQSSAFTGTLDYTLDGQAVEPIRILIDEAQTPDLFQTAAANIAFNHPFKESTATQAVPAVETFNFSSDFEGIETGRVVKIDSYFDFDLNPSDGSLPRCELTIMQAGRILFYQDYMDAQTANPISYKAVAGGGQIQFIGKATSTNELSQLMHMYTSDQTVYFEGKYAAIFNQLMEAGIALATASLKSRLTNLENLPVQDITALQNSYNTLLAQVNNPVLAALSQGSITDAPATATIERTALGDAWEAVLEAIPIQSPYERRVLTNTANVGATLTAGAQQAVIGEYKNGAFYGKAAQYTVVVPAHNVDNAFQSFPPGGIPLGINNQHSESSTSFPPTQQIPTGAVLQAVLSLTIAGGNPANFTLANGENNVFTNSGETATVFFDVINGVPRIRITEGGANSLPLDNGTLTGFIRYAVAQATNTIPASETLLFNGHAPIIIEAENPTASTSSNLTIIYGDNQRFDTHTSGAYQDFYVELSQPGKEIFRIVDAEYYNLNELDISAFRMGLFRQVPHAEQEVTFLTGLNITDSKGKIRRIADELDAMAGGGGAEFHTVSPSGAFKKFGVVEMDLVKDVSRNLSEVFVDSVAIRQRVIPVSLAATGTTTSPNGLLRGTLAWNDFGETDSSESVAFTGTELGANAFLSAAPNPTDFQSKYGSIVATRDCKVAIFYEQDCPPILPTT